jgi:hypothetical protein
MRKKAEPAQRCKAESCLRSPPAREKRVLQKPLPAAKEKPYPPWCPCWAVKKVNITPRRDVTHASLLQSPYHAEYVGLG